MNKVKFYVCPICGNIFFSTNESIINCCGINLSPLEANEEDTDSLLTEKVEDEYFISIKHEMKKEHYISFIASVNDRGVNLIKLYPEENCEAYFQIGQTRYIYYYCNKHGLFKKKIH